MKRTLLSLLAAAALSASATAQIPTEMSKSFVRGGSISSSLESNYTGNSYGMAFGDNPVVQTYAELQLPRGIAVGIWNNYDSGLDRKHCFNEVDYVASAKLPLEKVGIPSDYSVSLTGIHLTFPHTGFHTATTASLSLSKKNSPFTLDIYKVWGKDSQQGYAAKFAYDTSTQLNDSTKIKYHAALLANSHVFTQDTDLSVLMGKISLEHKFTPKTSVNIGIRHQMPINKFGGTFSKRTTLNAGISRSW